MKDRDKGNGSEKEIVETFFFFNFFSEEKKKEALPRQ